MSSDDPLRLPASLVADDTAPCTLGDECVLFQKTGSVYGASHNCQICSKLMHNLCNYGRRNPTLICSEYDVEYDEVCSAECYQSWLAPNLFDPPDPQM